VALREARRLRAEARKYRDLRRERIRRGPRLLKRREPRGQSRDGRDKPSLAPERCVEALLLRPGLEDERLPRSLRLANRARTHLRIRRPRRREPPPHVRAVRDENHLPLPESRSLDGLRGRKALELANRGAVSRQRALKSADRLKTCARTDERPQCF